MADVRITAELDARVNDFERDFQSAARTVRTANGQIDASIANTNRSLATSVQASGRAGYALTNLGRVVSDAPFGFVAIQNNLDPLIQSFTSLQRETGSTGGAFRSLFQSLAGPAGLALGFTIATSAITYFSQHPEKLDSILSLFTGTVDETTKAIHDMGVALSKAGAGTAGEVAQIQALVKVAQDESASRHDRINAINELNSKMPEHNRNLSIETINTDKAATAISNYTQSLVDNAKVQGLVKLISDESVKVSEAQSKTANENATIWDRVVSAVGAYSKVTSSANYTSEVQSRGLKNKNETIKQGTDKIAEYTKKLDALTASMVHNNEVGQKGKVSKVDDQRKNILQKLYAVYEDGSGKQEKANEVNRQSNYIASGGAAIYAKVYDGFYKLAQVKSYDVAATANQILQNKRLIATMAAIQNVGVQLAETIGNGLTTAFADLFTGSTAGFANFGKEILKLVAKIAAAIVAAYILSAALSAIFPGFAIVKGASNLSSLTSAFSGIAGLGSALGFANGGIVSKPTLAMIGEGKEPEIIAPKSDFNDFVSNISGTGAGVLMTKVQGTDLLIWIDRANKQKGRIG